MSSDELFLVELLKALGEAKLEALIVGSMAAVLQGAPVTTQDIDLLIRDTPKNREKIEVLCERLGGAQALPVSELTRALTLVGPTVPVDLLFDSLPGDLTFESLRSRSVQISIGDQVAVAASLADVVKSKQAANRPKDVAQLPTLINTLRVKEALDE